MVRALAESTGTLFAGCMDSAADGCLPRAGIETEIGIAIYNLRRTPPFHR